MEATRSKRSSNNIIIEFLFMRAVGDVAIAAGSLPDLWLHATSINTILDFTFWE